MKTRLWMIFLILLILPFVLRAQVESPGKLSLSLDDCIKIGFENNLQVKMAEAKVSYAEGKLTSARSYLIPKVALSGLYTHLNTLPEFKTGEPMMIPTSFPVANSSGTPLPPDHIHLIAFPGFEMSNTREGDIYQVKIEATYPLYTGGRTTEGYKASQLELEVAREELNQAKQDLVFQIRQAYYQVLLAQEMVKVIDDSYALMEKHYKQVKDLYREGYVSNLDVLQVEAKLSAIKPQQIQVHNGLELAQLALKNVLNLDPGEELEVRGQLEYVEAEIPELKQVIEQAKQNRADLKTLELRKEQTDSMYKIARAGYLPTVALFANYQWNMGQEMPPNDTIWREGYQAGVSASIDLFDGFKTYGEMKAAKSQQEQIRYGEQALRSGIEIQVTAAYLQIMSAKQQVDAEKKNVEAAQKSFEASQNRYREGMVNHLDVLDAEVGLTQAKSGYLRAVADYLIAQARLDQAMGKIEWEAK